MPDVLRDQLQSSLGAAYTLDRELGGGGMSRVFVARDEALGREVVVKVLAPELAEGLSAERFAREIRLAAGLQEPHIVPVLAAGTTGEGLPYYTMPFVEGQSLRARLSRGAVPPGEAVSILRDVARALAYAHEHRIVHRDIKPENILLSSGTAVVTDFGIAKALQLSRTQAPDGPAAGRLTRTGSSLGTPAYMAPEQAAGDAAADHRADLYAWGIVAYELLAGRHPFAGRTTPQGLLAAHLTETPVSLADAAGGATPAVRALVMRCLAKNPAARPSSAAELVAVLDGAPLGGVASGTPRARVAAMVGVLLLLVAAGVAWTTRERGGPRAVASAPVMLAVLPFDHAGPADQVPFTDGLTDAVTAKLGGLSSLGVIDRRSASQYRASTKPARQIGRELGVQYLLQGVVRWAKDGRGAWRARVTPTLVDARSGTTRWTGDPVDITLDDPFTAQGATATDVAVELALALAPGERTGLARRFTDDPQALAANQRGQAIVDAARRAGDVSVLEPATYERAVREFERAVALDSNFAEAWANLAQYRQQISELAPDDRAAEARATRTLAQAQARAPDHPRILLSTARQSFRIDADTTALDSRIRRAVRRAPNDAIVLVDAAWALSDLLGRPDSAYVLNRRSAVLDPRERRVRLHASRVAMQLHRWNDALQHNDAWLALDPTDPGAWQDRIWVRFCNGDTLGMQRELSRALARLPHPTPGLWSWASVAGGDHAKRFAALSARDLGAITLNDSVSYYLDSKTEIHLGRGDLLRSRVYSDSIRALLHGRSLAGAAAPGLLTALAFAQANVGRQAEARQTLERALTAARSVSMRAYPIDVLDPASIAGIYARLGEPETAVRWLAEGLVALMPPCGARAYAITARLGVLRGTPSFERFLRAHPE